MSDVELLRAWKRRDAEGFHVGVHSPTTGFHCHLVDEAAGEVMSRLLIEMATRNVDLPVAEALWGLVCELNWGEDAVSRE